MTSRVNYESFFPEGSVYYLTGGLQLLLQRWSAGRWKNTITCQQPPSRLALISIRACAVAQIRRLYLYGNITLPSGKKVEDTVEAGNDSSARNTAFSREPWVQTSEPGQRGTFRCVVAASSLSFPRIFLAALSLIAGRKPKYSPR